MLNIADQDFKRLVDFVKSNYGIDLSKKRHSYPAACPAQSQVWVTKILPAM